MALLKAPRLISVQEDSQVALDDLERLPVIKEDHRQCSDIFFKARWQEMTLNKHNRHAHNKVH